MAEEGKVNQFAFETLVPLSRKRFSFPSRCFDQKGLVDGTFRAKSFASVAAQIEDGQQA